MLTTGISSRAHLDTSPVELGVGAEAQASAKRHEPLSPSPSRIIIAPFLPSWILFL